MPVSAEQVEKFLQDNAGLNERAIAALRNADPEMQEKIMERGNLSDANDPSAVLMSRVRNAGDIGLDGITRSDLKGSPEEAWARICAKKNIGNPGVSFAAPAAPTLPTLGGGGAAQQLAMAQTQLAMAQQQLAAQHMAAQQSMLYYQQLMAGQHAAAPVLGAAPTLAHLQPAVNPLQAQLSPASQATLAALGAPPLPPPPGTTALAAAPPQSAASQLIAAMQRALPTAQGSCASALPAGLPGPPSDTLLPGALPGFSMSSAVAAGGVVGLPHVGSLPPSTTGVEVLNGQVPALQPASIIHGTASSMSVGFAKSAPSPLGGVGVRSAPY